MKAFTGQLVNGTASEIRLLGDIMNGRCDFSGRSQECKQRFALLRRVFQIPDSWTPISITARTGLNSKML